MMGPILGPWRYRSYREHLATRFPGQRIRKLCLHAGFTCPNIDGRRGRGGCSYCDNAGFVPAISHGDLRRQWDAGRQWLRRRHRRVDGFIAYFQSFSNTYGSVEDLHRLYDPMPEALPDCVGLSISTRPDCVPDPVLDLLADLARRTYLCLELGLQSDRDSVLRRLNRGHSVAEFLDAVERAAERGIELCMHLILGLPGEGWDAPERLGELTASLPVRSVKIHNFHVMRGTPLARAHARQAIPVPEREDYLAMVRRLLVRLRPDQCVQRVIADAPDRLLLSGGWCHDKQGFLRDLAAELDRERDPERNARDREGREEVEVAGPAPVESWE